MKLWIGTPTPARLSQVGISFDFLNLQSVRATGSNAAAFFISAEEPFLIMADHHEIRKLSVDGSNYTILKQASEAFFIPEVFSERFGVYRTYISHNCLIILDFIHYRYWIFFLGKSVYLFFPVPAFLGLLLFRVKSARSSFATCRHWNGSRRRGGCFFSSEELVWFGAKSVWTLLVQTEKNVFADVAKCFCSKNNILHLD